MTSESVVVTTNIDGAFEGFDGDTLFTLSNGMYWVQDEYKYWYYYAYCPRVEILNLRGRPHIRVHGQRETVAIRQVSGVIRSKINGEFRGWDGSSTYELINGQVWEQIAYRYKYKYSYMPEAVIFNPGGGHVMQVAGTSAKVRRVK